MDLLNQFGKISGKSSVWLRNQFIIEFDRTKSPEPDQIRPFQFKTELENNEFEGAFIIFLSFADRLEMWHRVISLRTFISIPMPAKDALG